MTRRHFLHLATLTLPALFLPGCARRAGSEPGSEPGGVPGTGAADPLAAGAASRTVEALDKPRSQWRESLTPRQYAVLFEEDTERPWSSALNDEKRRGTYVCAACNLPLFLSGAKFDSGTGWPSFTRPLDGRTATRTDYKIVFPRTEYHCARCGGHQGHVFDDGPAPTGQRWCNNGVALTFVPEGEALPELRR